MAAIDIVFLVAYFVGVAAIGYWSSRKSLASIYYAEVSEGSK